MCTRISIRNCVFVSTFTTFAQRKVNNKIATLILEFKSQNSNLFGRKRSSLTKSTNTTTTSCEVLNKPGSR